MDLFETLEVDKIEFCWEDLLPPQMKRPISEDHMECAKAAWEEGSALYKGRAYIATYSVAGFIENSVRLSDGCGNEEILHVGEKIGYLYPAQEVIIAIRTIGIDVELQMRKYGSEGEVLLEHYMNVFGVKALGGVKHKLLDLAAE